MNEATVPPSPGMAPMMVPMTDPRSSTVQCRNTAATPLHKSVIRRDKPSAPSLATDPPFNANSIIWLIANMPVFAFRRTFGQLQAGEGAAVSVLLFLMLILLTVVYFAIYRKEEA